MGCAFCKHHQAPSSSTGVTAYDVANRKMSTPRRVSVVSQPTWMNSHKGSIDSDCSQPPIYFLSGTPAMPVYATPPPDFRMPPKKAPRLSGFKETSLSAVPELPSRPPRKVANGKHLKLSLPGNSLEPPDSRSMPRTPSSASLPREIVLPEETAHRLESYLKKNQSFSSIHMLLSELQAQSNIDSAGLQYDTEEDDEQWSPTCQDLGGISLPTSRRHSKEKIIVSPPPVMPSRKKRSLKSSIRHECVNVAFEMDEVESESGTSSHWDDLESRPSNRRTLSPLSAAKQSSPLRSPSRLSPFDLRKFSAEDEYQASQNAAVPSTPGPWFDRDGRQISPSNTFIKRDTELVREDAMVTPPPSEESDDEPLSPVIAQSILLKVLRGLSSEGSNSNPLVSRRGSVGNVSLSGLREFIKTLQQQPLEEEDAECDLKNSPSMVDLQVALSDMLDSEKINEKEQNISA